MAREYILKTRLTPAEQAKIQRLAELTDGTMSEVVRALLKDAKVVVKPVSVLETEPLMQASDG